MFSELGELSQLSSLPSTLDLIGWGTCKLGLDGMEHLGLKVLYVSCLYPHCLWNALDLWNVHCLFFLFLFWSLQEFSIKVLMVE